MIEEGYHALNAPLSRICLSFALRVRLQMEELLKIDVKVCKVLFDCLFAPTWVR